MTDITFNADKLHQLDFVQNREWIETNGLGGWASDTLAGLHTRRYHGLLVAALNPPIGRNLLLSKMPETLFTSKGNYELDCNNFNGVIHPSGFRHLHSFKKGLETVFTYKCGEVMLQKSVLMAYGHNTTIIRYELLEAPEIITLRLKPFIAYRDYHWLSKANDNIKWSYNFNQDTLKVAPYQNMPELYIHVPGAEFHYSPDWYFNYLYKIELDRGMEFKEDLFTYGEFLVKLKKGDVLYVTATIEADDITKGNILYQQALDRKKSLLQLEKTHKTQCAATSHLLLAADQFVVKRGQDLKTIIAGYHWFSDWGRDTMISLPGLCLVTGKLDDAKRILKVFALSMDQGMIPNRFPDVGEEPEYNTVDATLWYFVACYYYMIYGGEVQFVLDELLPILEKSIDYHIQGTRYNIKVDTDGLLQAGLEGTQLTWMDAKVGNWVVTPRHGKPVEINALWYNALQIMGYIYGIKKDTKRKLEFEKLAEKTKTAFLNAFVKPETQTLYDLVRDDFKDPAIRPNQLFAISLPFELVDNSIAKAIVKECEKHLVTYKGLRSLSDQDKLYNALYQGDQLSRDGAYHQGTTWSWLAGPYLEAKIKAEGKAALPKVKKWMEAFSAHLSEAGIGTVSEIFDGSEPYEPKGCMAQAWGVAEPLRICLQYLAAKE